MKRLNVCAPSGMSFIALQYRQELDAREGGRNASQIYERINKIGEAGRRLGSWNRVGRRQLGDSFSKQAK